MKLLLHACCGPCSIYPLRILMERNIQITLLFFNPNIQPLQEYIRRRQGLMQVAEMMGISVLCPEKYDPKTYFREVVFREEHRCRICYTLRLERSAHIAKRGRFDAFSTTLLYSKFQQHDLIRSIGEAIGTDVPFYYEDFRHGWKEGIKGSKDLGIYRQQYCGCLFSEAERWRNLDSEPLRLGEAVE